MMGARTCRCPRVMKIIIINYSKLIIDCIIDLEIYRIELISYIKIFEYKLNKLR